MKIRYDGKRWRIQVTENGRRYSFSSAKSKNDCISKYNSWKDSQIYKAKTVNEIADDLLEMLAAKNGLKSEYYYLVEQYLRLYVRPKVGTKIMKSLTLQDWQHLINTAKKKNGEFLSKKTLSSLKEIINRLIKYGYETYQCDMLRGTLFVPVERVTKEKEIIQPKDLKSLFKPSEIWFHSLFCFLALTGLRPSEGLGLQKEDIYEDFIVIRRGVTNKGMISEGKNKNARRIVPLCSEAKIILDETIKRNLEHHFLGPWIFCSCEGKMGNQSSMKKDWSKLKKERSLPGTVYSLRHTFVSLTKNLLSEAELKSVVGHSATMSTYETYAHRILGEEKVVADKLNNLFEDLGADWVQTT